MVRSIVKGVGLNGEVHSQGMGLNGEVHRQGVGLSGEVHSRGMGLNGEVHSQGVGVNCEVHSQGVGVNCEVHSQGWVWMVRSIVREWVWMVRSIVRGWDWIMDPQSRVGLNGDVRSQGVGLKLWTRGLGPTFTRDFVFEYIGVGFDIGFCSVNCVCCCRVVTGWHGWPGHGAQQVLLSTGSSHHWESGAGVVSPRPHRGTPLSSRRWSPALSQARLRCTQL